MAHHLQCLPKDLASKVSVFVSKTFRGPCERCFEDIKVGDSMAYRKIGKSKGRTPNQHIQVISSLPAEQLSAIEDHLDKRLKNVLSLTDQRLLRLESIVVSQAKEIKQLKELLASKSRTRTTKKVSIFEDTDQAERLAEKYPKMFCPKKQKAPPASGDGS